MINVLADQYLYNIRSYLPENIHLSLYDPNQGWPNLEGVHALLIRTTNAVTEEALPELPDSLEFIGTASAGSDHVDIDYLDNQGIAFSNAAGCNARSVAEYVAIGLLLWSENRNLELQKYSVGIVGVGHVGTQVTELLAKLGIEVIDYDPPRENRESGFSSATLQELLDCDILSFHTPLTSKDDHPTYHWLDDEKLTTRAFDLIINSSRGGVINEKALLQAKARGTVRDIIVDTWEFEPDFSLATAEEAFLKTPHIAGYSVQAKSNASRLVVEAMAKHFNIPMPKGVSEVNPREITRDISEFDSLASLLKELHPIRDYESKLEKIIVNHPDKRGYHFNKLRAEFPLRQEFAQTQLPASYFDRFSILKDLGFSELPA